MSLTINTVLLLFLLFIAIGLMRVRNLLAMVMLFSVYSLLVAGMFVVLDAPDVSFTEAAVGTGISTVLMIVTLASVRDGHDTVTEQKRKLLPMLLCIVMGAALFYGTQDLPRLGDSRSPIHTEVGAKYVADGQQDTGVPNLVTAVLASYRGFDTLGEVTVVLTAGIGVLMLLTRRQKRHIKERPDAE